VEGGRTYRNAIHCLRVMAKEEGIRALFKGMSVPLVSRAVFNSLSFGTYKVVLDKLHPPKSSGAASWVSRWQAGVAAGLVVTFVICPSELIKIRLQLQHGWSPNSEFPGPIRGTALIIKKYGPRVLFLGLYPTLLREMVASSTFFTSYFAIRDFMETSDSKITAYTPFISAISGGIGGVFMWACCYPIDLFKTHVQKSKTFPVTEKKDKSFYHFMKYRYEAMGVKGWFYGLSPALVRAIPTSVAKLVAYDFVIRLCLKYSDPS